VVRNGSSPGDPIGRGVGARVWRTGVHDGLIVGVLAGIFSILIGYQWAGHLETWRELRDLFRRR
jgi:hypothetical protein